MIAINEIWECRMVSGGNTNPIPCFCHGGHRLVLTHGFIKKIPMTPGSGNGQAPSTCALVTCGGMNVGDNLSEYIVKRKKTDERFAEGFDDGYREIKIGHLLRNARSKTLKKVAGRWEKSSR
jgi:hypothetical protein